MTGAYITKDAGESWRMFSLGAPPSAFAFDPKDPSVIYAATAALWRSSDAGRTWAMIYPDPEKNTVVHAWTDHADFVITTDDPAYAGSGREVDIHAVAVDPSDSRFLAMAVSSAESPRPGSPGSPTRLLVSSDGGHAWGKLGDLGLERAFAIGIEGRDAARTVRAVAENGVFESAGGAFSHLERPPSGHLTSASFGRDPGSGRTLLYVSTLVEPGPSGPVGGLFVSEDGGHSWRPASGDLLSGSSGFGKGEGWGGAKDSRPALGPVATSADHGLVAYAGLRGLSHGTGAPKFNGIAKTVDGGRTWRVVQEEADRPSANLQGSWIEKRAPTDGYSIWFDAPYDLGVAPTNPDMVFVTDLFRTYRTVDGGATWEQVNSVARGESGWTSRGLDVTNAYGIHWDPFDSRRVFISSTDI
ncbi:MAG: hypothetical protein L3K06_05400, partial [Thermoplasmata archaeon]|nr:hypothetical protein [Thermoplasmata archaeon]